VRHHFGDAWTIPGRTNAPCDFQLCEAYYLKWASEQQHPKKGSHTDVEVQGFGPHDSRTDQAQTATILVVTQTKVNIHALCSSHATVIHDYSDSIVQSGCVGLDNHLE